MDPSSAVRKDPPRYYDPKIGRTWTVQIFDEDDQAWCWYFNHWYTWDDLLSRFSIYCAAENAYRFYNGHTGEELSTALFCKGDTQ